jgi:hypothetical protein
VLRKGQRRIIQVKVKGIWWHVPMESLEPGDRIRVCFPNGQPMKDAAGNTEWVIRNAPGIVPVFLNPERKL